MKKLLTLLFVFLFFVGCALSPNPYRLSNESVEKLLALLQDTGENKIRAFTGKTGGTSGKLDSVSVSVLSNNDLAFVFDVSASSMYYYKFNSTATDAESDPDYIRPDDYSTAGVWYLLSGFYIGRSATPSWNFRDSGCSDYDDNVRIYVDCTDIGSGTEDCDFTIAVQVDGTLTDAIIVDADGTISFPNHSVDASGGNLEIPNNTSDMTIGTQGQIGFEVTDDQIVLHGGSVGEAQGEVAMSVLEHIVLVFDPGWAYDQESTYRTLGIMYVGDDFPEGFTLTEWKVNYQGGDPTTELDADIICDTTPDFNPAAGATVMDVIDTTAGASSADSGFDSATCANGSRMYVRFGADPTDDNVLVTLEIWGYAEAD